ncbi:MAG: aminotransferase [Methylobacterium sp.]|nr:aminotransferase [Methylobacterium sp.]
MTRSFNSTYSGLPMTVFETMSRLAREHRAVNLGQGFPDDPGAPDIRRKAADAVISGWNQYPPMMGIPELREAVSTHFAHHQEVNFDPDTEIMVTSGATEAIAGALFALIEPGDEVVLFEPMYDAYLPLVKRAGGIPKFVKLSPPDWRFTAESLMAAFSPRTKLVLFNNPLNPSATVCPPEDLAMLAHFCMAHDALAVCDEVWEHVVFDGLAHVPLCALPGMRERTVKISSAGKIFSLTGWKVGFVMAPAEIMRVLSKSHQFLTFTTPPNLQAAVAYGLAKEDAFFQTMRDDFRQARDYLANGLKGLGFSVLPSQGTYFLNVDLAPMGVNDDVAFCRRLVTEHGVAAIPVSAFYAEDPVRTIMRLCFAKKRETLDAALERLSHVKPA